MEPESCVSVFEELLLAINDDESFDGSEDTEAQEEIRHGD